MKKWILALVCTIAAGTVTGSAAAWAVKEAETAELERRGCSMVIANESEDVIYSVSVSYLGENGEIREATQNRYLRQGQKAYFAIEPAEDREYCIRFQLGDHHRVEAILADEFETDEMNLFWLTGADGSYVLNGGED